MNEEPKFIQVIAFLSFLVLLLLLFQTQRIIEVVNPDIFIKKLHTEINP